MKKLTKKLFKTQAGRFVAALIALVLAAAAAAGAGCLTGLKADVTAQQVMTIDPAAEEIVRALEEEVTLYYLASESGRDVWVDELLGKYDALSDLIHYEMVDPASSAATDIATMVGASISENTLVAAGAERVAAIAPEDFYKITYNLMSYYTSGTLVEDSRIFAADEQIANALLYVTRDDMPVVYMLSGHGETALGISMREEMWNNNIDVQTLVLDGAVPQDAAMVMIYAPLTDITQAEAQALSEYVQAGGKLVLLTNYMLLSAPNLNSVMAYYGMQSKYGIAVDMTEGYCYATEVPYYITPAVARHELTDELLNVSNTMLMPMSSALERNDTVRDTLKVTALMTTSENAYLKNPLTMTVLDKEDGDEAGLFTLAMAAEEGESRVVWFAGSDFINDENIEYSSQLNLYLLDGIRGWMLPETAQRIAIEDENLLSEVATTEAGQNTIFCIALFVPALLALIAGVVLLPRKRAYTAEE